MNQTQRAAGPMRAGQGTVGTAECAFPRWGQVSRLEDSREQGGHPAIPPHRALEESLCQEGVQTEQQMVTTAEDKYAGHPALATV